MTANRAPKQLKDTNTHLRNVEEDVSQGSVPSKHADILHLQSTIGNQAVQRLLADGRIQRDEVGGTGWAASASKKYHLLSESESHLHLDPEIEAQIRLMQMQLQWNSIKDSLRNINLNLPSQTLTSDNQQPNPFSGPPLPKQPPLVPRGAGPETPTAGEVGDVIDAITSIPAVENATNQLRDQVISRAQRDWGRLSGPEKGGVITVGALIGSGVLTGILSNEQSRQFLFDQVQGRDFPVPGIRGLSFKFNLTGPEKSVFFSLDLMEFLSDKK